MSEDKKLSIGTRRAIDRCQWARANETEFLDLSDLQLTRLAPELMDALASVERLSMLRVIGNRLRKLPEAFKELHNLESLNLHGNEFTKIPQELYVLHRLKELVMSNNRIEIIPAKGLENLQRLSVLELRDNMIKKLPDAIGSLKRLGVLQLNGNRITELPEAIGDLPILSTLTIQDNPLSPELAAAERSGTAAILQYLRERAADAVKLYESKLILVGEGEVGKSCLFDALRGKEWKEHDSTHGIRLESFDVTDDETGQTIKLNGWDFGGQKVYRPTHQLFFSSPAIYLVVWKPREGSQAGAVWEWIRLIKNREPSAKILVVATHGGPGARLPDIDEYEIRREFGENMIGGFYSVDSRPDVEGVRRGITELRNGIAKLALSLPEVGREVAGRWQRLRKRLMDTKKTWMSWKDFVCFCTETSEEGIDVNQVNTFVQICHRLGDLIHFRHDDTLKDIVVLKPDFLATAISYVLDDEVTRDNQGLVEFQRLRALWTDTSREEQYADQLHLPFVKLMDRFDLSYDVVIPGRDDADSPVVLVAQLVDDNRPNHLPEWDNKPDQGESERVQVCTIVDNRERSAVAEGIFYLLICRLHKYSLGRHNFADSVHWRRGLLLDDDYNGRALIEHIGFDIRITVRAVYPTTFLHILTREVKWLIESFWEGLHCKITVPCVETCGIGKPGTGLFDLRRLIKSKMVGRTEFPCDVVACDSWQDVDHLLANAPAVRDDSKADPLDFSEANVISELRNIRDLIGRVDRKELHRFRALHRHQKKILSRIDEGFDDFLQKLEHPAKNGPRLFIIEPVVPEGAIKRLASLGFDNFRVTLCCEHSRVPLTALSEDKEKGVYEFDIPKRTLIEAAQFLGKLNTLLSLSLPFATSACKLAMNQDKFAEISEYFELSKTLPNHSTSLQKASQKWGGGIAYMVIR